MIEPRPDDGTAAPTGRPTILGLGLAFAVLAFKSIGGGLAAWSQRMIVEERRWLTQQEFLAASTICGILPGANQVNMAVFVGTRYRGLPGAVAAVFGLVAFPALAALAVGALYLQFRDVPQLRHFLAGMSCAAVGLAMSVAWKQGLTLRAPVSIALALATFLLSAVVRAPLWLTLAVLAPLGFVWAWRNEFGHRTPAPDALARLGDD